VKAMQCRNCSGAKENHRASCIEKVPIFSNLTTEEIIEVSMTTTHRDYKKGEIIYLEGETAEKLFIISKGKVKIYRLSETGKEQIIRVLGPGDFMGELSLFIHDPLNSNAEALEATTVCIADGEKVNSLIEKRPSIALKIIKEMSTRLEKAEELIESLGIQDVEQRVADTLLKMADDNNFLNLSISKKDLAAHIGMSQETLSRKLSNFQQMGLIKQEGQRKIKILNRGALEDIRSDANHVLFSGR
jgi:CRP/FNR family transcriptional regulator, anaerobic regulatory protein